VLHVQAEVQEASWAQAQREQERVQGPVPQQRAEVEAEAEVAQLALEQAPRVSSSPGRPCGACPAPRA